MQTIIINGYPLSGKSTFAEICCKYVAPEGLNISTVDYVKKVAEFCGWTGTKTAEDRRFLSALKKALTDWGDIPLKNAVQTTRAWQEELERTPRPLDRGLVFIHCREPHEIFRLQLALGARTLLVRRPEMEWMAQSNPSDNDVLNYEYDYVVMNTGTLSDLEDKAVDFLGQIGIHGLNVI